MRRMLTAPPGLNLIVSAAAALGALLVLLLGRLLMRDLLRPISRLSAAAQGLAAGRNVEVPAPARDDEMGRLSAALQSWNRAVGARLAVTQAMAEVSGQTELDQVLELGSAKLTEALGGAAVMIRLRSGPTEQALIYTLAGGLEAGPEQPPERAILTEVLRSDGVVLGDLRDPRWDRVVGDFARKHDLGPALSVPLTSGGQTVGAVSVCRAAADPAFSTEHVQTAELMVPALAAAINAAHLIGRLRSTNLEMERASRHKTEFLATMSHELRTPLNSILGFSQLLLAGGHGLLDERQARYVGHIESSGRHLLALINDVLDLSKVEAGQVELRIEVTSVREALAGCLAKMQPQAQAKGVRMGLGRVPDVRVRADQIRLRQVVLNLLSNAVKFTPEGGRVTLGCVHAGPGTLAITVTDSGGSRPPTRPASSSASPSWAAAARGPRRAPAWACRSPSSWPS